MSSAPSASLTELLAGFELNLDSPHSESAQKAVYLARALQQRASALQLQAHAPRGNAA